METLPPPSFVEEIDFNEIELDKVVGKGTFGLVRKGQWRNQEVAVKLIETEQERKAFFIEVRQLSRVNHPNIVHLYGACTKSPVCLVMEYAEGGSLYNVLHCSPKVNYTAAHAISWVLQCAKGVSYLHNMKPKALIHRDLKPPNLLLIMGGTILKICDFGTACDMQTVMTNNKGSAAWMAPEVFEGSNYSEKCDVFSWGIILWEVLTRRKPFDEIGGAAFRIMWAVHIGQRPPLIEGCPKPLEDLMIRCWSKDPKERPSMSEVEEHLTHLFEYFKKGADQQISNPVSDVYGVADEDSMENSHEMEEVMSQSNNSCDSQRTSQGYQPPPIPAVPVVIPARPLRTSAPASLSSSQENLKEETSKSARESISNVNKRKSADLSGLGLKPPCIPIGHRRTGSYGSSFNKEITSPPNDTNLPVPDQNANINKPTWPATTFPMESIDRQEIPDVIRNTAWPLSPNMGYNGDPTNCNAYLLLEPKLQPLPPALSCKESLEIFEAHRRTANEFLRVQTEIGLLLQRKKELKKELQEDQQKTSTYIEEYLQLRNEKDGWMKLRENLKRQIELIKAEQQKHHSGNGNSDDWVIVTK